MKVHIAEQPLLSRILTRRLKAGRGDADLKEMLVEVLSWANRFVPSSSGSIFLDDPELRNDPKRKGKLYFAACFGKNSSSLAGTYLHNTQGIAGETYRSGKPYISEDVMKDEKFHGAIDKKIDYRTRSIICVPIDIHGAIIGVIELINKKDNKSFNRDDLALLEIFAGYTASYIENALSGKEFKELSRTDDLSRLYNDRYFMARLESEARRAVKGHADLSMIFLDLDGFKEVNDRHGHLAGSEVLREVGAILKKLFDGTDAIMSRYGGDEYVIILPGTGAEKAAGRAEEMREGIASHVFLRKRGSRGVPALNIKDLITCSVGVASYRLNAPRKRDPRKVAEALIRASDRAMYIAKEKGKNKVVIFEGNAT
jgi:diguanylate cyclase (GGDEF)-like protein